MKFIRIVTVLTSSLLFAGCVMPWASTNNVVGEIQQTYWAEYYETQCNKSVWGEDTADQVISYYKQNYGITIEAVEFTEAADDAISCTACGCPTGQAVRVQTNLQDRIQLLELGFVKDGEAMPVITAETSVDEKNERITEDAETTEDTESVKNTNDVETVPVENENTKNTSSDNADAVEINDATTTTDTAPVEPTAEDKTLEDKATRVQQALVEYYAKNKNYPEKLDQLGVDLGDLAGINYTPIGTVPASYYDITVNYSTGKVTLNP